MTLQENAFMKNLIMQNYQRRMRAFFVFILISVISETLVIYFFKDEAALGVCLLGVFSISFMYLVFRYHVNGDSQSDFPWKIKKRQLIALYDHSKGNGDFSELASSPCLAEYFHI